MQLLQLTWKCCVVVIGGRALPLAVVSAMLLALAWLLCGVCTMSLHEKEGGLCAILQQLIKCSFSHPSLCPSFHVSFHPSILRPLHSSIHLSLLPSIHPSVHPFIYPFIHLSFHHLIHPSTTPSIHPSIRPSIFSIIYPSLHPFRSPTQKT